MNTFRIGRGLTYTFLSIAGLALAQAAHARDISIFGTPKTTVAAGRSYEFTPATTGDVGRRMTFTVVNKPSWAKFNKYNGSLAGTPTAANAGIYARVKITVTDGKTTDSLPPFTLTVTKSRTTTANSAPALSGSPAKTVTAGATYNFVPRATDADGDALKFSISSKPAWATFDARTGRLWGVPTSAQAGSYEEIVISVSDGKATTKLPQFEIDVTPATQTARNVTLSWNPPTSNVDGSALTNLAGYRIHYGTRSGSYTQTVKVSSAGLTRYMIEDLQAGKYYFVMVAVNSAGAESEVSDEVSVDLS